MEVEEVERIGLFAVWVPKTICSFAEVTSHSVWTQPLNSQVESADKNLLLRETIYTVCFFLLQSGSYCCHDKNVMSHILSCTRKSGIVSHEKKLIVVWRVLRKVKDTNSESQQSRAPKVDQARSIGRVCQASEWLAPSRAGRDLFH